MTSSVENEKILGMLESNKSGYYLVLIQKNPKIHDKNNFIVDLNKETEGNGLFSKVTKHKQMMDLVKEMNVKIDEKEENEKIAVPKTTTDKQEIINYLKDEYNFDENDVKAVQEFKGRMKLTENYEDHFY
jgi:uncharacterized protein YozE (UPF0346 family)